MAVVSVIIPVYNVNCEYMNRCMESLFNQTFKDIEIIIIDDGSNEETAAFCDLQKNIDERIQVFHCENKGVSAARNYGTELATGEYIMYLDSDDMLLPHAISDGLQYIKETNSDMVIAAVIKTKPGESVSFPSQENKQYHIYTKDNMDDLRSYFLMTNRTEYKNVKKYGYIGRGPWARIIKSDVAKNNPFPVGQPLGEDVLWNMQFTNKCSNICVVLDIWYCYVIYGSSSMRKYYGNREEILCRYAELLKKENADFIKENVLCYAKNLAMEFYTVVSCELLSEKCPMTSKEKRKTVKEYLNKEPWNVLNKKEMYRKLSYKYRFFLFLCRTGLWTFVLPILIGE